MTTLLLAYCLLGQLEGDNKPPEPERINRAIDRGVEYLLKAIDVDPAHPMLKCDELLLYALVHAGKGNDARVKKLLDRILKEDLNAPMYATYNVSLRAMALAQLDAAKYQVQIAQCAWWLVQALSSMLSPDQKRITIDGFYDDVVSPGPDEVALLEALRDQFDASVPLRLNDAVRFKYDLDGLALLREYLYQPSLNIDGLITGDVGPGTKTVLPHEARAKIDIRLVPRMRPERVIAQVKDHLRRGGYDMIDVVVHQHFPGAQVPLDTPAVQALLRAYAAAGIMVENRPRIAASAPFWVFSDLLGVPLAVGGPGHGGRAHSPDEYATIDGMRAFEKSMVTFLYELSTALSADSRSR